MADDRTEQPTARRRRDARRKGQIARSRDLVQAGSLAASVFTLAFAGQWMMERIGRTMAAQLGRIDRFPGADLGNAELGRIVAENGATLALVTAPVALAAAISTLALFTAQGGWNMATEALQLNFGKLNPAQGFKRLGFSAGGIDTLKMVLLVVVLAFLAYRVTVATIAESAMFARLSPFDAGIRGWEAAARLLKQASIFLLAVGLADYGVQRWRLTKSLKMTKQEVKEDHKMTEGNPEVKSRIRRIQYAMARRRMLAAVPKATVVITNPTHFAVALEYHRGAMTAPRVLAKGKGFLAQRIKAIAREHGVPMVENVPLAQALYKGAEVGDFIPAALFEAVAEVLAYLIRLKRLAL